MQPLDQRTNCSSLTVCLHSGRKETSQFRALASNTDLRQSIQYYWVAHSIESSKDGQKNQDCRAAIIKKYLKLILY